MSKRSLTVLVVGLAASSGAGYLEGWGLDEALDGWTQRLGLAFSDDCQESMGLSAVFAWATSWLSGRKGRQRSAHCESKQASCPKGLGATGLQVRSGHMRKGGSRELYDFRLRCGEKWQGSWLGLRFDVEGARDAETAAGVCPSGSDLTGVQVMRGRSGGIGGGRDYYTFKLRCARQWHEHALGLPFDALKETRSATCPHGRSVSGIRVHRGFQDFGSIDTYEFQLQCLEDDEPAVPRGGVDAAVGKTTLSELLSMGADEAWNLVNSLLAEPPTAVHASFDASQQPRAQRPSDGTPPRPVRRPTERVVERRIDEL